MRGMMMRAMCGRPYSHGILQRQAVGGGNLQLAAEVSDGRLHGTPLLLLAGAHAVPSPLAAAATAAAAAAAAAAVAAAATAVAAATARLERTSSLLLDRGIPGLFDRRPGLLGARLVEGSGGKISRRVTVCHLTQRTRVKISAL